MEPRVISLYKKAAVVFFFSAVGGMVLLFYAVISIHMQNAAFNGYKICLHIFIEMVSCMCSQCLFTGFLKQTCTYAKLRRPMCARHTSFSVRFNLTSVVLAKVTNQIC